MTSSRRNLKIRAVKKWVKINMQKSFQWMLGLGLVAAGQLASAAEQVLEEVKVVGTRGSLMSAAGKQADADALISVVDSDAMGDFPDTTAAEAVRRLSGISIENDQGEGRYVTIRGSRLTLTRLRSMARLWWRLKMAAQFCLTVCQQNYSNRLLCRSRSRPTRMRILWVAVSNSALKTPQISVIP